MFQVPRGTLVPVRTRYQVQKERKSTQLEAGDTTYHIISQPSTAEQFSQVSGYEPSANICKEQQPSENNNNQQWTNAPTQNVPVQANAAVEKDASAVRPRRDRRENVRIATASAPNAAVAKAVFATCLGLRIR